MEYIEMTDEEYDALDKGFLNKKTAF